jgi:ATP/maltotriose-dependent transcriptional regulator MalT
MAVILTKVRMPRRRKEVVRRVRLLDLLHRNLGRKLIFVSAPAGYGKTTLLVDFANDLEATICWYSIGADQSDLASFAEYLIAAFQQKFSNFGSGLSQVLHTSGAALDPISLATEFVNEMAIHVTDFCVLMLDDFHLVGEAPAITDFIEATLDHLPDQVRVVIAGRSFYGIPSVTLHVRDALATIGEKDLRFRADELQLLIRQNYRIQLPAEQAAQLAKVSDGWIVAILLATRSLERGELPRLERAKDQLYAFLAEEVLNQQPQPLQSLLLATAILDEFDEPLCNHLLETDSSEALLSELSGRNLFVTLTESGEAISYQYHHLFSEFLRDRLWRTAPERARALYLRAADWFAAREAWELAVRHRLAAGDREGAAHWMDRVAPALFIAGHAQLLSKWVDALAEAPDLRARAPRLMLSQASVLIDQSVFGDSLEQLLEIAERVFRNNGDDEQVANTLLLRGMARRYQSKSADAHTLALEAQSLLSDATGYRWYQSKRLEGICVGYLGNIDQAIANLEIAVAGFKRLEQIHDLAETLNDLGLIQFERGDMSEAQNCWLEVLEIRRKQGNRSTLALALNNVGYLFYQAGRYQQAWQVYEEALRISQSTKAVRTIAAILCGRGDLLRDLEEWEMAQAAYEAACDINQKINDREGLGYTYTSLADLERKRRNFNDALYWLREAVRHQNGRLSSSTYHTELGAIYLDMGQFDLAQQSLNQVIDSLRELPRPNQIQALAEFLLARTWFEAGKAKKALEPLANALRYSAQLGYDQFLVVAGRDAEQLLTYAAEAWPRQSQLRSLIQRINQFQPGLAGLSHHPATPEVVQPVHLELFAFGAGRIRHDGELIPNSNWVTNRGRALLFYLAERGRVTKEGILLDFWPDFSSDKASTNLHSTLWRVRKAIGRDVILFKDNLYQLSPSAVIWHDVSEFETQIKRAADNHLSFDERLETWRRAIALYEGDYLTDVFLEWANERRLELQKQYLLALMQAAGWELNRRRYSEARFLYEKAVACDPLRDDVCAGMMECLFHLESPAAARAYYLAYKKLLKDELGVDPPESLRLLFERMSQN